MTLPRLFRNRSLRERDFDEEIQAHLRLAAQDRIRNGETPEHAELAARREFGNTTLIRERARDVWGWAWLDQLVQDARFAVRTFAGTPAATAIIILTLALGIGVNTAIFSIFDAVLLRQLPYRDPSRLVSILDRQIRTGGRATFFDLYSDYENWKRNSRAFEAFAASTWAGSLGKTMTGSGSARTVTALPVTADYFQLLGAPPVMGRTFEATDIARGCNVVLSYDFWLTTAGARKNLIGKSLQLDDQACIVLGVMPPGFASFPNPASMIWILMNPPQRPDQFGVFVMGRLKPGISPAAGQAELLALHRRLHQSDRWGKLMEPAIYELQAEFTWLTGRNLRLSLILLFAAVSVVLLICCANVANLLLGRSLMRQREMAIRAALGSSRGRLLRQLLTENLLLSVTAAFVGAALAVGAVHYFRIANPVELPPATVVRVDARILAFTVLLSIVTAVLFGLFPAWGVAKASRTDLIGPLKAGGRISSPGRHRFGKALIAAEVALTMLLLIAAGLLIDSVRNFASAPLGFRPDGLMTANIQLPKTSYPKPEQKVEVYDRLIAQLRGLREIQALALSTTFPTQGTGPVSILAVEGQPDPSANRILDTGQQTISPEYFQVMGIPLRKGRFFDARDRQDSEAVAIVNEALVARYFPTEDPIGKHIREFDGPATQPWLRIVGVAAGEKRVTVTEEMNWGDPPVVYRPWRQDPPLFATLIIRTAVGLTVPEISIQRSLAAVDPDVSVNDLEPVVRTVAKVLAYPRFRAVLLTAFAGLALLLAVVGLYGVLSHLVSGRIHEIGVRMALGATRREVLRMVVLEGMFPVIVGVAFGLGAAWGLTRTLSAMLYGVSPRDPVTLLLVTSALLISALFATWFPAWRATAVDPMVALRYE